MIFVRGIMGNIKLNPAIKLWGGLALFLVGIAWAGWAQLADYREEVAECQAIGGVWIGGVPFRVGAFRLMDGTCELPRPEEQW